MSGLAARATYAFRLCAHNSEGDSNFSPTVEIATILGVAAPPALLVEQCAKKATSDSLWLRWSCDEQFADAIDRFAVRLTNGDWTREVRPRRTRSRSTRLLPERTYR